MPVEKRRLKGISQEMHLLDKGYAVLGHSCRENPPPLALPPPPHRPEAELEPEHVMPGAPTFTLGRPLVYYRLHGLPRQPPTFQVSVSVCKLSILFRTFLYGLPEKPTWRT